MRYLALTLVLSLLPVGVSAQMPSQAGRYQIFFSPSARADTFLVDTATGKVWQLTTYTDLKGEPRVWQWVERADDDKQLMQFFKYHGLKSDKAK